MTIAGSAVGAALSELKGELEASAKVESHSEKTKSDIENMISHKSRDITHHYKITKTDSHSVEIDDTSAWDKLATDDKKITEQKEKRSGCFSWCFGRKG